MRKPARLRQFTTMFSKVYEASHLDTVVEMLMKWDTIIGVETRQSAWVGDISRVVGLSLVIGQQWSKLGRYYQRQVMLGHE